MRFFGRFRRGNKVPKNRGVDDALKKKESAKVQLNLWIPRHIKEIAHLQSGIWGVPIGALCGHCLEVGMVYLTLARKDPEEEEQIKHHLFQRHVMGNDDGENMFDHMLTSAPVLASLLKQDVMELDQAITRLDSLAFEDSELSEMDWRKESAMARIEVRTRMLQLRVKLHKLSMTDHAEKA